MHALSPFLHGHSPLWSLISRFELIRRWNSIPFPWKPFRDEIVRLSWIVCFLCHPLWCADNVQFTGSSQSSLLTICLSSLRLNHPHPIKLPAQRLSQVPEIPPGWQCNNSMHDCWPWIFAQLKVPPHCQRKSYSEWFAKILTSLSRPCSGSLYWK